MSVESKILQDTLCGVLWNDSLEHSESCVCVLKQMTAILKSKPRVFEPDYKWIVAQFFPFLKSACQNPTAFMMEE